MPWKILDDEEFEEEGDLFSSLFSSIGSTKLYKNYNIIKNAKLARINKTLFFPKLKSINHRPKSQILEFWNSDSKKPKIVVNEEDFIEAKIICNKMIMKDIDGNEHKVEPICLKNVLDNSEVI